MKTILSILFIFVVSAGVSAQLQAYTFEEAERLSADNPKPFIVYTYTTWCKYCGIMKNSTFKDPEVISLLNEHFYFIALNAEETRDILFRKRIFIFQKTGVRSGIHQLAVELATVDGEITYPSLTILESNY
ncbi:MAG TPA: DUF255 domain-containing protein, partial [Flavobacterium sp.]